MLPGYQAWPEEFAEFYRQQGCWEGITFGEMLRQRAAVYGNRAAIISGGEQFTYAELDTRVDRLAAGLCAKGIRQYDRVIVQLPNIPAFVEVIFALFRLGALPVFALPLHRKSEIEYFARFSEAVAYLIPDQDGGFDYRKLAAEVQAEVPSLRHIIVAGEAGAFTNLEDLYMDPVQLQDEQPVSSDVAFLQLSGGSTGLSKMIPRTHDDYIYSLRRSVEVCGLSPESVYLAVLPVAHNYPLSSPGILGTLYAGGTVVLSRGSSPDEAFPLIKEHQVTITALVPPLALIWLNAAAARGTKLTSLQVLQVGGAKFSAEVAGRVRPVLGCTLQQVFGMAEGLVNYTRLDDPEHILINTQGKPMSPYDEVKIVDDEDIEVELGQSGHLLTRGPYTIRGYYKSEEHNARAFTTDGFYRTGDIASLTPEGYLIVEGRAKDQINRGGDKVAAEEVENHLLAHPGVHDAALVSMPDEYLGERSCAFIVPSGETPAAAEIKSYLRSRGLASYKIPDRVEFVQSFPKTGVGKVSKKALREMLTLKQPI
ncbi:(2,3-dihydroxybenzoyl)adenylate synthase [Paenibacillus illinoisensis]|uniref:(2,3-dihydroxybenzoyl)adenylate synthase n=1 Tax=Paenibacillus illinoisensis TaxID=59845 RepID=UPI001C8D41E7|nr:(2,3-dihydroxybenzoyl)adenylate synthase [Paenibacillus illinoisensis]MBY0217654.1 (2,3-dihydroxybenzoyl)adenylate synthase [Paenibacillus illinoisensis]